MIWEDIWSIDCEQLMLREHVRRKSDKGMHRQKKIILISETAGFFILRKRVPAHCWTADYCRATVTENGANLIHTETFSSERPQDSAKLHSFPFTLVNRARTVALGKYDTTEWNQQRGGNVYYLNRNVIYKEI